MPNIPKKQKQRPWITERKPFEGMDHSNQKFYNSARWKKMRQWKLSKYPLCELCKQKGKITSATMVDHIKPINQGGKALCESNLMSLCKYCHAKKSGKDSHKQPQDDLG